jgi:hypothetical protein
MGASLLQKVVMHIAALALEGKMQGPFPSAKKIQSAG